LLGKLNCDEFAMGSSNETSFFGNVVNPYGKQLVPGGSSGGSASALAAELTPATIGTDTGGSIRQPASFTGTVGLKPTYGRCSRWGIVAFASSLDQAGPMTKNVEDCALLLQAMSGYDPKDSTSVDAKVDNYTSKLTENVKGLKIGIPKEYIVDNMPAEIDNLWKQGIDYLKDAGAIIKNISLPHTMYALPAYYIVAPAEASSNLARYDGVKYGHRAKGKNLIEMYENTRSEGFGDEVKRRILIGTYVLSSGYYDAYYLKAQKVRQLIKNDFDKVFGDVDAILTPSTPSSAFKIGEKTDDPVSMYLNDIFTVPVNLSGLPAISVPSGYDKNNLPLGLQIIGKAFDEQTILNLSLAIEKRVKFKKNFKVWWS
jgi:aspartyl-tRNA(Asn)/glutamyl-tRNA(Gln) amidotransferase subunit A